MNLFCCKVLRMNLKSILRLEDGHRLLKLVVFYSKLTKILNCQILIKLMYAKELENLCTCKDGHVQN